MEKVKEYLNTVSDITKLIFFIGTPLVALTIQVQVMNYKIDSNVEQRKENIVTMQSDKVSISTRIAKVEESIIKSDKCCASVRSDFDSFVLYHK